MASQAGEENLEKKDPFENLTKEDLIKKCKQFLGIAQKAKQAKDDLAEEVKAIKLKSQDLENKSQDALKPMQEMVENLTQQKLQLVMECDHLKKDKNTADNELTDVKIKIEFLETANESYNRQVNRLSEENEQLLTHLSTLEKEIQQLNGLVEEQSMELEKQNNLNEANTEHETSDRKYLSELEMKLSNNIEEIKQYQLKCDNFEAELKANNEILSEKDKLLNSLHSDIDTLKTENNQIVNLKNDEIKLLQVKVNQLNLDLNNINTIELLTKSNNDLNTELNAVKQLHIETENKFQRLIKELACTRTSNELCNEKLKSHHSKLIKAFADLKDLKQVKCKLLLIVEDYSKYVSKWQNDITEVSNHFIVELNAKDNKIERNEKQIVELKTINDALNEKLSETCNEKTSDLLRNLENKELKIISLTEEISKISTTVDSLSTDKTVLLEKNSVLSENNNVLQNEVSSIKRECSDLQNQLTMSKRENVELLKEMNDMNQALKERGETISKQQECAQELIRKIEILDQELSALKQQKDKSEEELNALKTQTEERHMHVVIQKLNDEVEEKNCKINTLEKEIEQLKEYSGSNAGGITQDSANGDSETMSTSTISRLDEAARLRDLDGSWEERYTKLRTLALKLKGKVKELSEQLTLERNDRIEIQNKLTSVNRNLQSIQTEHDKLLDQYELITKENKEHVKDIATLSNENEDMKQNLQVTSETINKLEHNLELITKEKVGTSSAVKQYVNQIQNLKKDIEKNTNCKKELENRISVLESTLMQKKDELETQIKAHNDTKDQIQKFEKEIKKKSVLSLEMEDYERSLKDISQKLDKKQELVSTLEEELASQKIVIISMNNQLNERDQKISAEEVLNQELAQQVIETKTKLSEFESTVSQKDNRIREILRSLEDMKANNEEMSAELAQVITQDKKHIDELKSNRDHLTSKILGLEGKVRELMKNLNDREQELKLLHEEFSGYKVRAQSVLRQNQSRDVAVEEKLSEEVEELKSQISLLKVKLDSNVADLVIMSDKYELAEMEKTQSISQCQDLEKALAKEKESNNILGERQQKLVAEHREAMRTQKVHTDTLSQCYKAQLAEQETRHIKELADLQATHSQMNAEVAHRTHDDNLDITSMLREDGEDKLLNMDVDNLAKTNYEAEFLTTNNGDERLHLVPVLNTILKLSPEESQKLNAVIKGPDTSLRRLGSYLPLWNN
ncbi:GRIP and coiled-coil domain containing 185 kDa [Carabus blaptoides fortunei]